MTDEIRAADLGLYVVSASGYEEHILCPFHDDKSSSASWNYQKGMFYCQTCKVGFNLRQMASKMKLDLKELSVESFWDERYFSLEFFAKETIIEAPIKLTPTMQLYLDRRGIGPRMIRKYFSGTKDYKGVMIQPTDYNGKVQCSITRIMNPKPKQPRYYVKGEKPAIWPFNEFWLEFHTIVFVEGIFSRVLAEQALGFCRFDTTAYGTPLGIYSMLGSSLKEEELTNILGQTKYERLVFLFDNDYAGECGAKSAKLLFPMAETYVLSKKLDEISAEALTKFIARFIPDGAIT